MLQISYRYDAQTLASQAQSLNTETVDPLIGNLARGVWAVTQVLECVST